MERKGDSGPSGATVRVTPRVSQEQKEELLHFMLENPGLATNRIVGPQAAAQKQRLWAKIAEKLNGCSSGATKTPEKWAKVWQDWRCDTKQKAARIKAHARGTGGGPSLKVTALTPLEERLLGILGQVAVEGHLDVPDSMQVLNQRAEDAPIEILIDSTFNLPPTSNPHLSTLPPIQIIPTPTVPLNTPPFTTTPPITPSTSAQYQPFDLSPQPPQEDVLLATSPPQQKTRKRKRPVTHNSPREQYEERLAKAAEERAAASTAKAAAITSMAETFKETSQFLCETLRDIKTEIQKNSPKSTTGKSAAGPLATRNRVIPWRLGPCHGSYDKENISAAAEATASHEGPSILSLINSPPPKRLGNVLASPLKARHPLEDYDPNSQDSGFGNSVPEGEEFRGLENSPSLRAKLASSGFHVEASKSVKIEEHSRLIHQNEKVELSRQISITSTSSVDESILSSPSRPLALSQQSNSSTPGKKGSPHRSPRSLWSISKYRSPLRHSHSSGAESIDDGFLEIFEMEKSSSEASEAPSLPAGIGCLLSKPIVRSSEVSTSRVQVHHPTFRRCVSLVETTHTPPSSRARLCLFRDTKPNRFEEKENSEEDSPGTFGFKRPEPPEGFLGQVRSKKRRCLTISQPPDCDSPSLWGSEAAASPVEKVSTPPIFQRSVSDSEAVIKRALLRSSLEPDLIGDFTRPYSLPLIPGRHQDLKTISSDTLAGLLQGEYEDCVDSYSIIDCRYPYEYEGGHIKGAKNLFTHEQILKEFMSNMISIAAQKSSKPEGDGCEGDADKSESKPRRDILVFHCEFSSERGPRLSRFLRNSDRDRNKECYPALHYPEIYLLHGGYKEFFDKHRHLCEPCSYLPMADPRYESDLRSCRAKSKSWTGGMGTSGMEGSRLPMRGSLKRLGL